MTASHRIRRLVFLSVVSLVLVAGALFVLPYARDWLILRNYEAPATVKQLAVDTSMTDRAERVFFINRPQVQDRDAFNQSCKGAGEQTIILGCYHSPQRGIFVFKVDEPELKGIEQVTAAHEMLHAAYDRLSRSERRNVDTMLLEYYTNELKDERILRTIELYKKTEPNDLANEMHSIFGTEIGSLPPSLEAYYGKYFSDRTKVTNFAAQYQQAFTSRQQQIDAYDTQLNQLRQQIVANQAELTRQADSLRSDRARVEASRDQETVDAYNQRIVLYNQLLAQTNKLVDQYNSIVEKRNAIATEQTQLENSIDSAVPRS